MFTINVEIYYVVLLLVISGLCLYFGYQMRRHLAESKVVNAEDISKRILEDAGKEVENRRREAVLEAKDALYKNKQDFDKETKERRLELQDLERRILIKEEKPPGQ